MTALEELKRKLEGKKGSKSKTPSGRPCLEALELILNRPRPVWDILSRKQIYEFSKERPIEPDKPKKKVNPFMI